MGWGDQHFLFAGVVMKPCLSCAETKAKAPVPLKALLKLSTNFTIIILGKMTMVISQYQFLVDKVYSFVFSSC